MKENILKTIEQIGPELDELSRKIYEKPETAYEEVTACKLHVELLEKYGFQIEKNLCGIETGFKAEYDSGKPGLTVGIMAEYDALPGIGHGCGHNILGATGSGAGIALKSVIDEIGGKVIVYGTPAEEYNGAKMAYARKGAFDELDFGMMAHPNATYNKCSPMLALGPVSFAFHGKPSHASAAPEEGRNALDALILAMCGINALRQQMKSSSRVHGIVVKGGEATNVIPDYASAQFVVRSLTKTYNEELRERVRNCARGAALQTGTEVEFTDPDIYLDNMISNRTMEQVFCDKMKELFDIEVGEPSEQTGSNDAGLLSKICPFMHPMFGICPEEKFAAHTEGFRDATLTDYAKEQMRNTAAGLAMTAVEVMTNPQLFAKMKAEFESAEQ
ncbi:M20 family metallopeptidase [Emergencia sp.]|uniref:M20 family metallopeptidase n=1 Tax=Emergencia sp. TaxID=1926557 RepID=UPI003AF04F6B